MRRLAAPLAIVLAVSACTTRATYLVAPDDLRRAAEPPPDERRRLAVPARRTDDLAPAYVRAASLPLVPPAEPPHPDGSVIVESAETNRMIVAGNWLTWVGTAISLVGTGFFVAGIDRDTQQERDFFLAGGLTALSAEALMWTGTGLWIAGTKRRPQELPPGKPDVRYLGPLPTSAPAAP